jgi:uncharacterized protein YkwD
MKTRSIHRGILLFILFILMAGTAWGAVAPSEEEQALLDRINAARRDPFAAAVAIGVDPQQLAAARPELLNLPEEGMSQLAWKPLLSETAKAHNEDMLARGFVDRVNPEGLTAGDRAAAAGYWAVSVGESIGVVGFANFLAPDAAVSILFENMLREEILNPSDERWNLLNPRYSEAGVAVGTGVLEYGGYLFNVYIAVCDFGEPYRIGSEEELFLALVNQARSNPEGFLLSAGISADRLMPDIREGLNAFFAGMPPLFPVRALFQAARAHAEDMLTAGYFAAESLDGRTAADRILEAGYEDALESGETRGLLALCGDRNPAEQVEAFFRRSAIIELTRTAPEDRLIFNPSLREAGVGFAEGDSESLGGICGDHVGLLVAEYGTRIAIESGIVGVVFSDLNGNGLLDPGEGLSGIELSVSGSAVSDVLLTGEGGGFHIVLPEGPYEITTAGTDPVETVEITVPGTGESVFVPLSVTVPAEEVAAEEAG